MSHFGEFLVQEHVIDRFQLFRVLQMQDRNPGVRFGECAVALGYVPMPAIQQLLREYGDPEAWATVPFVKQEAVVEEIHDRATAAIAMKRLDSEDGEIMLLIDVDDDAIVGHAFA